MKIAIIKSSALSKGPKVLQASPYAHPTFHIDRAIDISKRIIARSQKRLANQLAERERLIALNKQLRAED